MKEKKKRKNRRKKYVEFVVAIFLATKIALLE
jgi:hypothetical protein